MSFFDAKDVASAAFDAAKLQEYLIKANTKRDLTPYGLALENEACV